MVNLAVNFNQVQKRSALNLTDVKENKSRMKPSSHQSIKFTVDQPESSSMARGSHMDRLDAGKGVATVHRQSLSGPYLEPAFCRGNPAVVVTPSELHQTCRK